MSLRQVFARTIHQVHIIRRRAVWLAPLMARITLGILFISTGWGKVHNLDNVTAFFTELRIPGPAFQATLVSYVELIGGALILVGLYTELAAIPLIISMFVAIVTAKRSEVHGLPDLFGLVEWTYLVLLAWLAIAGPGKVALTKSSTGQSPTDKVADS